MIRTAPNEPKEDRRKYNRGSNERKSYSNSEKVMLVDEVQDALDNGVAKSAQQYFEMQNFTVSQAQIKAANYNKWRYGNVYSKALQDVVGIVRANAKRKFVNRTSPFRVLESRLYIKFRSMRQKNRKVSSNWIRINALKEFQQLQADYPEEWGARSFNASHGWFIRFMKRKNIKY